MNELFRRVESLLEVAVVPQDSQNAAIVIDRAGGMRIVSADGWSLSGLIREFGAGEVYRVERRAGKVTVEGWSPAGQCVATRADVKQLYAEAPAICHTITSQVMPRLSSGSNERAPSVWNS